MNDGPSRDPGTGESTGPPPGPPTSPHPGDTPRTGTVPPAPVTDDRTAPHAARLVEPSRPRPAGTPPPIEIIAHRGASADARENTLDAFQIAVSRGAHRIETDIRRTKDNILVLHHDPALSSGHPPLTDLTLPEARREARSRGFELPTLDEALATVPIAAWDLELKDLDIAEAVVGVALRHRHPADIVFTSFHDDVLRHLRVTRPDLTTGLILGVDRPRLGLITRWQELHPLRRAHACGAGVLIPHHRFLRYGFMTHVRRFRGPVWVWTVNEPDRARTCLQRGVRGLITDRPETLLESLPG